MNDDPEEGEVYGLENNEKNQEQGFSVDPGSMINVTIQNPDDADEAIDLGQVARNFKKRTRIFIWLTAFCLLLGIGLGLLTYQLGKKPTTVSAVVTLDYPVLIKEYDEDGNEIESEEPEYEQVKDLSNPLGDELDLNQVTSSYVLQNAMSGLKLSQPITLSFLRANIRVDRILTEESRRNQEMAAKMLEQNATGTAGYERAQTVELVYDNRFIVSLTNGFGLPNSDEKIYLTDLELQTLLDRILACYNDYLVLTYADKKLPDDEIGVIDIQNQDLLESLDLLRTATNNLQTYCEEKPENVLNYRSWKTGSTLENLEDRLTLVRDVNVDYLYSYVYANSIAKDVGTVLTNFRYQLRDAKTRLDTLNEKIETTKSILEGYKNDEIFVSMQESDTSKSTKTTTDYFNKTMLEQAKNFEKAAELEITISDLENKIANLEAGTSRLDSLMAQQELKDTIEVCHGVYQEIADHMEEIFNSSSYNTYARASGAQFEQISFLSGASKSMMLLGVGGLMIALGLWFLSALAPEFNKNSKAKKEEEEKK